jgi:hypothetical protein
VIYASRWPRKAKGTPYEPHVEAVLARLGQEAAPASLLSPPEEAAWLWLQTHEESQTEGRGNLLVDLWSHVDLPKATECVVQFAAQQKGMVQTDEVRRFRCALSVAAEPAWNAAREVARGLFGGTRAPVAKTVLAYLFPEEEAWGDALQKEANQKKSLTGYAHLLAFAGRSGKELATLIGKGGNVWGLLRQVRPLAGSLVLSAGAEAVAPLEVLAARWPDEVAPFLEYARAGR